LYHLEWGRYFVLHYLNFYAVTCDVVSCLLNLTDTTNVKTDRCVEFQRVTAGCCFRVSEHHTDLFTKLVDKYAAASCFGNCSGEFTQRLRHETCLEAHFAFAHFAFEFTFWNKGSNGVDYDNVNRSRTNQVVGDFEGLFTIIRL